jgi:hypothetical protein
MHIVLVCILPMLSFGMLVFSAYKAYQLNKQQKQCIKLAYRSGTWPSIDEQVDLNTTYEFSIPAPNPNILLLKKTIGRKIQKHLRMLIVSFEFSLFLIGFNLAFLPANHNDRIDGNKPQQFENGKIAYLIEDTMQMESCYNVIASISKSQFDSVLFVGIGSVGFEMHNSNKITSRVSVSLIDPTKENFVINPLSTEEQIVDDSTNSIWRWLVKPTKGGNSELILKVTIRILDELGNNQKDFSFIKTIIVKASIFSNAKKIIQQYWQFLSTAVIIPVLIFLGKKIGAIFSTPSNKRNPIGFKRNK